VVLMDQPFAALVKELFEVQKYPEFHAAGAATAGRISTPPTAQPAISQLPYDVTGWTLPMQMGVEVVGVSEPIAEASRGVLRKIDTVDPVRGKVEGAGPTFAFSRNSNAAFRAVNDILEAGGTVAFSKTDAVVYATGKVGPILQQNGVDAKSIGEPGAAWPVKNPRIAIYEQWAGNIDEGWTRWIFEQFHFKFAGLRNPDIQAGHLRARFDTIIIPEMSTRQIMNGMQAGSVPGQYAGGIGEAGADALREFVNAGGTLITLGNASLFPIDQFSIPVTNALAGLKQEQFFCSGTLLKTEIQDRGHPVVTGLPADPTVMFERNVAFDTKANFKGAVLASYPKDRSPLRSGYLLGPEHLQGKAAALDVSYGKGRVIMIGFRTQWRGQSHGTYKFLFNAVYYNASMAPESPARETSGVKNTPETQWKTQAEVLKTELTGLVNQNRAYFQARGPKAAEEGKKLEAMLDAFQRDRIPVLDDLRAQVEDAAASRREATFSSQLKKFATDLRTKDLSAAKLDDLLDQYKLAAIP